MHVTNWFLTHLFSLFHILDKLKDLVQSSKASSNNQFNTLPCKWIVIFITDLLSNDFITSTFLIFLKGRTLMTMLFDVNIIVGVVQAGLIKSSTTNNVFL